MLIDRIRDRRSELKLTQEELGHKCRIHAAEILPGTVTGR